MADDAAFGGRSAAAPAREDPWGEAARVRQGHKERLLQQWVIVEGLEARGPAQVVAENPGVGGLGGTKHTLHFRNGSKVKLLLSSGANRSATRFRFLAPAEGVALGSQAERTLRERAETARAEEEAARGQAEAVVRAAEEAAQEGAVEVVAGSGAAAADAEALEKRQTRHSGRRQGDEQPPPKSGGRLGQLSERLGLKRAEEPPPSAAKEPPMNEWGDAQLYAWVREALESDGVREEDAEHVLGVLRHNEIDGSVLVLLDETDLKDLGIQKRVAHSLVASLHMEFNPTDTFIGGVLAHYHDH